jgi:hypothetical protein
MKIKHIYLNNPLKAGCIPKRICLKQMAFSFRKNGGKKMRIRQKIKLSAFLVALAALAVALLPIAAWSADDDNDGYDDALTQIKPPGSNTWHTLDPDRPDLFVAVDRLATNSRIWPSYDGGQPWWQLIDDLEADGGFNFNVIEIDPSDFGTQRAVTNAQKGFLIRETSFPGIAIGECPQGTLNNDYFECYVHTERIYQRVLDACGDLYNTDKCEGRIVLDGQGSDYYVNGGNAIVAHIARYVMLHEFGHTITIARLSKKIGNHDPVGENAPQMAQTYTMTSETVRKTGEILSVTFHIPHYYTNDYRSLADLSQDLNK